MLRIGVDSRPLNFPHSGIGQYLTALLQILLPATEGKVIWYLYSDRPLPASFTWGSNVHRCGVNSSRLFSTLFAQRHFGRWATADRLDLFWSPRHQLPVSLGSGIPTVVTLHDLVFLSHPHTMTRAGQILERVLTPPSLRRATAIITTSRFVHMELRAVSGELAEKSSTIPLSSAIAEQPAVQESHDTTPIPFFLFCGSTEPRKNLDRLLRALASLKREPSAPPHRLIIVTGGGWADASTTALIERYSEFVEVRRNLTEAQKAALMRKADFLVLPSLTEGFGIPLVEAQKLGLPILTSRTGAMPEVAGQAALYVDPYDDDSIRKGLQRLCTDAPLRNQLRQKAIEQAPGFDWEKSAHATLEVLVRSAA